MLGNWIKSLVSLTFNITSSELRGIFKNGVHEKVELIIVHNNQSITQFVGKLHLDFLELR